MLMGPPFRKLLCYAVRGVPYSIRFLNSSTRRCICTRNGPDGTRIQEVGGGITVSQIRKFNSDNNHEPKQKSMSEEYIPFEDRKRIIQDVIEQQWDPQPEWQQIEDKVYSPVNTERGKTGVFDLDELVELLKTEHAEDICVIALPKEISYADHMVIVTARSNKHMHALATFIRKRFKSKERKKTDTIPKIEGTETSTDWLALDMGNITLHIFHPDAREQFDLETLWAVGPQYDDLVHQKDSEIVELLNLLFVKNPTK